MALRLPPAGCEEVGVESILWIAESWADCRPLNTDELSLVSGNLQARESYAAALMGNVRRGLLQPIVSEQPNVPGFVARILSDGKVFSAFG